MDIDGRMHMISRKHELEARASEEEENVTRSERQRCNMVGTWHKREKVESEVEVESVLLVVVLLV